MHHLPFGLFFRLLGRERERERDSTRTVFIVLFLDLLPTYLTVILIYPDSEVCLLVCRWTPVALKGQDPNVSLGSRSGTSLFTLKGPSPRQLSLTLVPVLEND